MLFRRIRHSFFYRNRDRTWVAFAIFFTFINLFVPFYEERDMERRFGEAYRDYCRRVPRWLPRFRAKGQ